MTSPVLVDADREAPITSLAALVATSTADRTNLVGWTVFWRNLAGTRIHHQALTTLLYQYDFERYTPKAPTQYAVLRAAIEAWIDDMAAKGQGDRRAHGTAHGKQSGYRANVKRNWIRVVENERDKAFIIVLEQADLAALGVAFATRFKVILDTTQKSWFVTTDEASAQAQADAAAIGRQIKQHYDFLDGQHDSGSLSEVLTAIIGGTASVALKEKGGIYFVPLQHEDDLERLTDMLADLGQQCGVVPQLIRIGVTSAADCQQMAQAAHAAILDEVAALAEEITTLQARVAGGDPPRRRTIEARFAATYELMEKVQVYGMLLDLRAARITKELNRIEGIARSLLDLPSRAEGDDSDRTADLFDSAPTEA